MVNSTYSVLQPMYPLLIQQFVDDYSLSEGIVIDIGTGPGFLGLEMAKITSMKIFFVDINEEALQTAKKSFDSLDCDNKVEFIQSDVHDLIFEDNFADFIMSRGSIWFWNNPTKGLQEIYRVLKPGGTAIIGGGLGKYVPETMRKRLKKALENGVKKRNEKRPDLKEFEEMVKKANLPNYKVFNDGDNSGTGKWIEIKK